jgi:hypothetical protein
MCKFKSLHNKMLHLKEKKKTKNQTSKQQQLRLVLIPTMGTKTHRISPRFWHPAFVPDDLSLLSLCFQQRELPPDPAQSRTP